MAMTKGKWLGIGCAALLALILLPIISIWILFGSGENEKPRFVEVPETPGLFKKILGQILINKGWDSAEPSPPGLVALSFPKMEQTTVRLVSGGRLDMSRISGPDRRGRIAFVKSSGTIGEKDDRWYSLQTIQLNGTNEKEVFRRKGDLLWDHPMGEIALAASTGKVAFIGAGASVQHPGALLHTGHIEIWDVEKSTGYVTDISALDEPLWWMPDGGSLIYTTTVARELLPDSASIPGSPFGKDHENEFGRWEQYPAACIFDLATHETEVLLPGTDPVLSSDGKQLMTRSGDRWLLLDLETKKVEVLNPPSHWNMPRLLLPGKLAVFLAPPKAGTTPRWLTRGSFKAGTQMWSLKVGVVGTWEAETIVPYMDFRDRISFGASGG